MITSVTNFVLILVLILFKNQQRVYNGKQYITKRFFFFLAFRVIDSTIQKLNTNFSNWILKRNTAISLHIELPSKAVATILNDKVQVIRTRASTRSLKYEILTNRILLHSTWN